VTLTEGRALRGAAWCNYGESSISSGLSQRAGSKRFLLLLFVIAAGPRRKVGDRTLAIEENARFEGMSRREENTIDTPSRVGHPQVVPIDGNRKGNGAPEGLNM